MAPSPPWPPLSLANINVEGLVNECEEAEMKMNPSGFSQPFLAVASVPHLLRETITMMTFMTHMLSFARFLVVDTLVCSLVSRGVCARATFDETT